MKTSYQIVLDLVDPYGVTWFLSLVPQERSHLHGRVQDLVVAVGAGGGGGVGGAGGAQQGVEGVAKGPEMQNGNEA